MSVTARIVDTSHGPEVAVFNDWTEIARFTVSEFETFVDSLHTIKRSARSQLSARQHLKSLPMR